MRSDESLPDSFRDEGTWKSDPQTGVEAPAIERLTHYYGPDYHRHSYSGYERNKLYLNLGGETFADISGVSGADNIADSRSWAALDYDRDGWTDIALVNANTPLLNLYRNRIGERSQFNHIKVCLIGGARAGDSSVGWSNRDAVGAVVEVNVGDRTLRRNRQLGEGFAAQNSAMLTIGIGVSLAADSIEVTWPSGKVTRVDTPTSAGSFVNIDERPKS